MTDEKMFVNQPKEVMLAEKITDTNITQLKYPGLCTYKLDGIRCLIINGIAVSRNFKPIRNDYIRNLIQEEGMEGFDGEIITGQNFQDVASGVMTKEGTPEFTYMVFDTLSNPEEPYYKRMERLSKLPKTKHIDFLLPTQVNNLDELLQFEKQALEQNYEGVMFRDPNGPYLFGRSTFRKQYLLKLKRFEDGEAIVTDFIEEIDKNGKPKDTLGSLVVVDTKTNIKFHVSSGMNNVMRNKIWNNKNLYLGAIVNYQSQLCGVKIAPRFPTFVKFRDEADLDKGWKF